MVGGAGCRCGCGYVDGSVGGSEVVVEAWRMRHRGGMSMRLWNYEGIGNSLVFGVILRSAK